MEDWDHMCGISVLNRFQDKANEGMCFNFYKDGRLRVVLDVSESAIKKILTTEHKREIANMGFWDMISYWRQAKRWWK
jgi:hypothetical protein